MKADARQPRDCLADVSKKPIESWHHISKVSSDLTEEEVGSFLRFDENKQVTQQSVCMFMGVKQRRGRRERKTESFEFIPIK